MAKQLKIAGTEPEVIDDLNEAAEVVRLAKAEVKAAGERLTKAQANLIQRAMKAKKRVYEFTNESHERWRMELVLPEPIVRLTFVGQEESDGA
jgi:capsule polysaccharide export protein KpsE/RkpR